MNYPADIVEECESLWTDYFEPALGKCAANQFRRAMRRQDNAFADNFLTPYLFRPDLGAGLYVPVDDTKFAEGRNHLLAETLAAQADDGPSEADPRLALSFFANPLRIGAQHADPFEEGRLGWDAPSSRVILAPIQIFTFEFDQDVAFLGQQLAWMRSAKNVLDCPMGALYRHCASYADFAGITVAYSGNKGIHIHLAFRTDLVAAVFPGLNEAGAAIRAGLIDHWNRLHADVLRVLCTPDGITADASVRFPEQYRRMPNGLRLLEKPSLLGVPAGQDVPQVTLWEKWPERAAKDATDLFFTPAAFVARTPAFATSRPARSSTASSFKAHLTEAELKCCEDHLAARFNDWPKFVRLEDTGGGWRALFQNDEDDRNPSSVMKEGYKTIMQNGRADNALRPTNLPFPLGVMMKVWVNAHRAEQVEGPWQVVEIPFMPSAPVTEPCPFQAAIGAATTKDEASAHLRLALRATALQHEVAFVSGPEGIRKTSSLFADHRRIHNAAARAERMPSMYAFNDYDTARIKCGDFNRKHEGRVFHAVVLPSLSEAYKAARADLNCREITTATAADSGFPNLWAAISQLQPKVIDHFRYVHAAIWREIGDRLPVFFSVHQVAHTWNDYTPTRAMWDRHFWDVDRPFEDKVHVRNCRRRMALGLLVHDEVEVSDLVIMHRAEVVDWVRRLIAAAPKAWGANRGDLAGQWSSYQRFCAANPFPVVGGEVRNVDFQMVREIARVPAQDWDAVQTAWSGDYGDEDEDRFDLYASTVGRSWFVSPRGWWNGLAKRVLVLTTECVPTALVRRIRSPWHVAEFEANGLDRDSVTVLAPRNVRSAKLPLVVQAFQQEHPGVAVISNKVAMLDGTTTHARARGSNAYIGQDVAQTMTFLSPEEYERLEALNVWCGRDDLVSLRHVDEFNQSAGRNLGFRRQGDPRHWLLIPPRLLGRLLARQSLGRARYDLRLQLDRQRRWLIKSKMG
ncbi:hypothetical protein ACN2C6_13600 [Caulobacter sp. ErkDOM-YI]|uniref:hypothetical protein n=1 Tax=unclassified Caulobacter TaxID=2648921 RepID=UPI003AF707E0